MLESRYVIKKKIEVRLGQVFYCYEVYKDGIYVEKVNSLEQAIHLVNLLEKVTWEAEADTHEEMKIKVNELEEGIKNNER